MYYVTAPGQPLINVCVTTDLGTVCLQSRPRPIMCSAAGYRNWFSQKMCNFLFFIEVVAD